MTPHDFGFLATSLCSEPRCYAHAGRPSAALPCPASREAADVAEREAEEAEAERAVGEMVGAVTGGVR
jgi:hypothetical protein